MTSLRHALAVAIVALTAGLGCAAEETAEPLPPVPPGDAIPEDVEHILFGKHNSCREDVDCASRVCAYASVYRSGTCMGILSADAPWMQVTVGRVLRERVDAQPALRDRIVDRLARVVARKNAEPAHRVRAIRALEALGAADPLAELQTLLPEILAGPTALALVRMGDARGLDLAAALTESDDAPLAIEAVRALGQSRRPEALAPLLRTLVPTLEHDLVRATVLAIGELRDPRAIRPLAAFLADAPEHLVVDTVDALRDITGARLAADPDAWMAWIARENPPPAPAFTPRERSSEDDLGIPTP